MISIKSLRAIAAATVLIAATVSQTPAAEAPPAVPVERLESLVADIQDDKRRAELVATLKSLIAVARRGEAEERHSLVASVAEHLSTSARDLVSSVKVIGDLPVLLQWLRSEIIESDSRRFWLTLILVLAGAVIAGLVAQRLAILALSRPRSALEGRDTDSLVVRLSLAVLRGALDAAPVAAFAAAAYAVLPMMQPVAETSVVVLTVVYGYALGSIFLVAARMLLMPATSSLRVLPIEDGTANYLFIWARRFVVLTVAGYCLAEVTRLLGLPGEGQAGLQRVVGLLVAALAIVLILQNRAAVAFSLRGDGIGLTLNFAGLRQRIADVWHVLAIIYVIVMFIVWALDIAGGFNYLARVTVTSVAIITAAHLTAMGLVRLAERGFVISPDIQSRFPTLEQRANRYLPVVHGVLRTAVAVVAGLVLLQVWGVDAIGWLETDFGRRLVQGTLSIAAVVVIALLVWEAVNTAIERYMVDTDTAGNRVERSARVRTLLPLLRNVIFIVLAVMVVLIVLSQFGIDIAPLLAGAGVVGLAVGFGAQTLIKDIITGLFILIEDTISIGDYIDVAGHSGTVEVMTIRTLRLRDPAGNVHTLPFSDVGTVLNHTKDFSYVVLDIGISYREDVDEVMDVVAGLGREMMDDPGLAANILEPMEVQGVNTLGESAVVIRARIKTRPGTQWGMRRAFNRLMKNRFDELGIEIPFPHSTIYFGQGKNGTAPPAHIASVASRDDANSDGT